MSLITRGYGLLHRIITAGFGSTSKNANAHITGVYANIYLANTTVSISCKSQFVSYGGGYSSKVIDAVERAKEHKHVNRFTNGFKLKTKLGVVIPHVDSRTVIAGFLINSYLSEIKGVNAENEEEIIMLMLSMLDNPSRQVSKKYKEKDEEILDLVKLLSDIADLESNT